MVTVLALIGVAAVLFAAAVLATRDTPLLADAPPDRPDLPLPDGPVQPEDVAAVRFSMAPRGYRMAEVDEVLARLGAELADRDRRLALLEATVTGLTPSAGPEVDALGQCADVVTVATPQRATAAVAAPLLEPGPPAAQQDPSSRDAREDAARG